MSRGRESTNAANAAGGLEVGYPPILRRRRSECVQATRAYHGSQNYFLLNSQISVGWPKENRRLSKALGWVFLPEGQCLPVSRQPLRSSRRPDEVSGGSASSTSLSR